jgi:alkylhydroperoxidase family enzyme
VCRELGVTESEIFGLANHRDCDAFSELEKLALDYAVALSDTPASVSDELYAELQERLNEAQLVELTAVIAFENYLARFNRGFAMQPQGFSVGAVCPLPDRPASTPTLGS